LKERVPKFLWTDKGKELFIEQLSKKCRKIFLEQSSSFYLDILPEIFKEYNNDYHNSIKMTPIHEDRVYFNFYGDIKEKFRIGDTVRISNIKEKFMTGVIP